MMSTCATRSGARALPASRSRLCHPGPRDRRELATSAYPRGAAATPAVRRARRSFSVRAYLIRPSVTSLPDYLDGATLAHFRAVAARTAARSCSHARRAVRGSATRDVHFFATSAAAGARATSSRGDKVGATPRRRAGHGYGARFGGARACGPAIQLRGNRVRWRRRARRRFPSGRRDLGATRADPLCRAGGVLDVIGRSSPACRGARRPTSPPSTGDRRRPSGTNSTIIPRHRLESIW